MKDRTLPLVSIITPAYNQGDYLAATIDSVLAQTYPHIEYIVIDDGSSDNTAEVMRRYAGRICALSQPNSGQANTLNRGWAMARGEVLSYLSSDDLLDPDAIARLMAHYPGPGSIVFPAYRLIDQHGAVLKSVRGVFRGYQAMVHRFDCTIGVGALFSRDLFSDYGGWQVQLRQIPDFDFWMRAGAHARFVALDEELASFRVHTGSQTFAAATEAKADESVAVVTSLCAGAMPPGLRRDKALAAAYVFSACLHLRSGRPLRALRRVLGAVGAGGLQALAVHNVRRVLGTVAAWLRYRAIRTGK